MQMQSNMHCFACPAWQSCLHWMSLPVSKCSKGIPRMLFRPFNRYNPTYKSKWWCVRVCAYRWEPLSSCHFRLNGWLIWLTLSILNHIELPKSQSRHSRLQPSPASVTSPANFTLFVPNLTCFVTGCSRQMALHNLPWDDGEILGLCNTQWMSSFQVSGDEIRSWKTQTAI